MRAKTSSVSSAHPPLPSALLRSPLGGAALRPLRLVRHHEPIQVHAAVRQTLLVCPPTPARGR
eukprot:5928027-Pyramimonas_sp.AAC.1